MRCRLVEDVFLRGKKPNKSHRRVILDSLGKFNQQRDKGILEGTVISPPLLL